MELIIDHQTCKSCNICIPICPVNILQKDKHNQIYADPNRLKNCLRCGQCMMACSTKSIQVDTISKDDLIDLSDSTILPESLFNFMAHRRSVRNFRKDPIEKEKIEKIIEFLRLAPFGVKEDIIHITVVQNQALIEKTLPLISDFYSKLSTFIHHPIIKHIFRRKAGIEKFNTIKGHLLPKIDSGFYKITEGKNTITRNAPLIMLFHSSQFAEEHNADGMIQMVYAMFAANSMGLGVTISGLLPPAINKDKTIHELFQIPKEHEVISALLIGYPKYKYVWGIRRGQKNVQWLN